MKASISACVIAAMAAGMVYGAIEIRSDYPGGNVIVRGIDETNGVVNVSPDLSDTKGRKWMRFDFKVRGAEGRTLRFRFPDDKFNYLATLGPAVSRDGGATWAWLRPDGSRHEPSNAFDWTFAPGEHETRFAFCIPYLQSDWEKMAAKYRDRKDVEFGVLCKSQSGRRDTEMLRIPCRRGGAKWLVVFTARHHASEASASFVMEGAIEECLSDSKEATWLRDNADCVFVPFMDKDGVEDGEQGKHRHPHDHNRDYVKGRYTSVRALRDLLEKEGAGRQIVFFDLHSPSARSGANGNKAHDNVFTIAPLKPEQKERWRRFRSAWIDFQKNGKLKYDGRFDKVCSDKEAEKEYSDAVMKSSLNSRQYVGALSNCWMSVCCEFGYSLCGGVYSPDGGRNLGHGLVKAAVSAENVAATNGCAAAGAHDERSPLRVAVYVDKGANNIGVYRWLEIASRMNGAVATPVDGEAVRAGALDRADLIVMPGGSSVQEAKSLGPEGREKVKAFVKNGGGYIGTCAGCCLLMEPAKHHPDMLHMIPFKFGASGGKAEMSVVFNERAKALADIGGKASIRYSEGPVLLPSQPVEDANVEVVATYDSDLNSMSEKERPSRAGRAAAVAGTYGKGRLFVFAVHPEYNAGNHYVLRGAFRYVTGRKVKWDYPQRRRGQLAVGFLCDDSFGVETARLVQRLVTEGEFDVIPLNKKEIEDGGLRNVDAVLAPGGAGGGMLKVSLDGGNAWECVADGEAALAALRAFAAEPVPAPAPLPAKVAKPIRAGIYQDPHNSSIIIARMLALAPEYELKFLSPEDYANGGLDTIDLIVQPGGGCTSQYKAIGDKGAEALRRFVLDGGKYYGVCAGAFMALQQSLPNRPRLGLVPFKGDDPAHYRGSAPIKVKFTEEGQKALDGVGKSRTVVYAGGPAMIPGEPVADSDIKILGTYAGRKISTTSGKPVEDMLGKGAFAGGRAGRGKVFISCPHPEFAEANHDIVRSGIKYLTGVAPSPVYPNRTRGALSVRYRSSDKASAEFLFGTLLRDRRFHVWSGKDGGTLSHLDAVVLTDRTDKDEARRMNAFISRGGTVVAVCDTPEKRKAAGLLKGAAIVESYDGVAGALLAQPSATAAPVAADAPIGVFDSGLGGLTVLERLLDVDQVDNATGLYGPDGVPDLAHERFTYLGDQANMPYGDYAAEGKSDYLRELIIKDAKFLLATNYFRCDREATPGGTKKRAKIIVIACNTATAWGLDDVRRYLASAGDGTKVVGVIEAGVRAALDHVAAKSGGAPFAIGVMATPGTIASGAYERTIRAELKARGVAGGVSVINQGCAGLADAVESGSPTADAIAKSNLVSLVARHCAGGNAAPIRVVILGCTHYPFVLSALEKTVAELRAKGAPIADDFRFIDPAFYTAAECHRILRETGRLTDWKGAASVEAFLSVANPSLPQECLTPDGQLTRRFKYGRDVGSDAVTTKPVQFTRSRFGDDVFRNIGRLLPCTAALLEAS